MTAGPASRGDLLPTRAAVIPAVEKRAPAATRRLALHVGVRRGLPKRVAAAIEAGAEMD